MTRAAWASALLGVAVAVAWPTAGWAKASCPSYELGHSDGTHLCGVRAFPGSNPTNDQWQAIFALVASGPGRWGARGPHIPALKSGCGGQETTVPAAFPCEIIKAIAVKESNWRQFCEPTTPSSQKGKPSQTMVAFDCGYGVSQVTSGMRQGETSPLDRDRVSSDPVYNMAAGASLLASKWQSSRCLGNRDPGILEHWYIALWKYNGYSYSNDPSNPTYSSTRGVWDPALGGEAPYQEKVFGIIEKGSKNGTLWTPIALAYPRIDDVAGRGSSPVATVACASPTDCTSTRSTHRSQCDLSAADKALATPDAGAAPGPGAGAGAAGSAATGTPPPTGGTQPSGGCKGCSCSTGDGRVSSLAAAAVAALLLLLARARRRAD
jgi:MYXO-CTERM domain-containing protein